MTGGWGRAGEWEEEEEEEENEEEEEDLSPSHFPLCFRLISPGGVLTWILGWP